jgi:hypothetical protein
VLLHLDDDRIQFVTALMNIKLTSSSAQEEIDHDFIALSVNIIIL